MKQKEVKIGLGEAISRLMHIEAIRASRLGNTKELIAEREMLFAALNNIKLDLLFNCNVEISNEGIDLFEESANNSCCRLNSNPKNKIVSKQLKNISEEKVENKKNRKTRSSRRKKG